MDPEHLCCAAADSRSGENGENGEISCQNGKKSCQNGENSCKNGEINCIFPAGLKLPPRGRTSWPFVETQATFFTLLVPSLSYLPQKLVHFVVDYRPDWITQLQLPASDGKHRQLRTEHFQQALQRLENMPEVDLPVQLFGAVDIQHRNWIGGQTVHADPFKKPKTSMVCYDYVHIPSNTNMNIHLLTPTVSASSMVASPGNTSTRLFF